jgi:hypothetical protein
MMNYYKKLSVAALLAFFCNTNSMAETLTVDAGGPVAPGTTGVSVNININTGANTAGVSFTVTYDAAKLQYKSVSSSFFATFSAQGITPSTVTVGTPPVTYSKGMVDNPSSGKVMLAAAQTTIGTAGAKTLFTLTFDVISGTLGSAVINVTPSTITNDAAGYPTATALPILTGIVGTTYPAVPVTSVTPGTLTIKSVDSDSDGIADDWEMTYFGNLTTATATSDFDKDGYTDKQEYINGGSYNPKVVNPPGGTGYVNNLLADTLVISFPNNGLYTYNSTSLLTQINSKTAALTVAVDIDSDGIDEIVSYFPGSGIYIFDNGVWGSRISSAVPQAMVKFGNKVAIDLGSKKGLYTYNTTEKLTRISSLDPAIMTEVDVDSDGVMELAAYFTGKGLYIFDNGVWGSSISTAVPEAMIKFGNKLAIDFGAKSGLYTYNAAEKFTQISSLDPTIMTAGDVDSDGVMELAAYFPGKGIYIYDNGVWGSSISTAVPEAMIKFGNRLAIDFGATFGLQTYNTTETFTPISGLDSTIMTEVDVDSDGIMELAVYFSGSGIYILDNGIWGGKLFSALPALMTSGNMR